MLKKLKEHREHFKQERDTIKEQIKRIVYNHKNFSFSQWKKKTYFSHKESAEQITDLEAEEFMMRFFGLFAQKSRLKKYIKLLIILVVAFYIYFHWDMVQMQLQMITQNVPFIKNTISFVATSLEQKLLIGMFLFTFFANLFFLTLPDEIYFIAYLLAGHNIVALILTALAGSMLGLSVDYFIGKLLGAYVLRKLMKKKYFKFKFISDRYGSVFLIVGNIVPSPVQWFSVFLGAFSYGYYKFIFYSLIGKAAKYLGLFYGFNYYINTLDPLVENSLKPSLGKIQQCLNATNTSIPILNGRFS